MAKCSVCRKKVQMGNNVSHSHRRTKRKFSPNIIKKNIVIDGKPKKIQICAKCYKKGKYL